MATPEESASQLLSLQKQRASAKGNITRIKKLVEEKAGSLNPIDLECRLEILNSYIKQLMAYQTEIERLAPDDTKRGELEEVCISTKTIILSQLGRSQRTSVQHDCTLGVQIPPANRLPHLKLPKFSGKYSEYKNFITCFNNLVHEEPSLTKIEKFNHLLASLQDDALRTVKAFQVNEENYDNALKRLEERYDNKCLIFQDHIASLFNLKKMSKPNASELREIIDTVSAVLDSLSHLGTEKDITHAIIIYLVLSKVDSTSKAKWDEQLNYTTLPQWSDCVSVLVKRCQFLEVNEDKPSRPDMNSFRDNRPKQGNNDKKQSRFSFSCSQDQREDCNFCTGESHTIATCPMFTSLNVTQRFEYTKKKGLCINCLRSGHSVKRCRASRCNQCQRPHHQLLHNEELINRNFAAVNTNSSVQRIHLNAPTTSSAAQCFQPTTTDDRSLVQSSNARVSGNSAHHATTLYVHSNEQIILATAIVQIKDKRGNNQFARALLDSGSQVNLITEEVAQRLSLKREDTCLNIIGIGDSRRNSRQKLSTVVKSCRNSFEFEAEFYILKTITSPQPNEQMEITTFGIPANIVLADPQFNKPQRIDMLIGAESFFDLLSVGQIKLGPMLPTLQKTLLGWIVSGKYKSRIESSGQNSHIALSGDSESLSILNDLVQRFWEIEQVPNCNMFTEEQRLCEKMFNANTQRTYDGRFEVRLPFKTDPVNLGQSFEIAKRRFLSLERRRLRDPELNQMYNEFMKEYIALNHMSLMDNAIPSGPHYFIPHQCVIRAHSTTTKLRVVFDASSKTSTHLSLNDILMVGPTIQSDLFSTLLRFRTHKYAITADVTKMYRQVNVHKDDRKFQLILWRENPTLPIQIYELNTVTYGTAPAPFLAIRCLKEISNIFKDVYPVGSNIIANDFYVDDLLTGADDVQNLIQIHDEVIKILSSCGFVLAKWHSNCSEYNSDQLVTPLEFYDSDSIRTLGIEWNPRKDNLCFQLENNFENLPSTKRNILSISSRLFDPLGLLAPIIIRAKIILQELWENNVDWDESIPQNLDTAWKIFKEVLLQIHTIALPRFVGTRLNASIRVHGFADASMRAYGCCLYVVYKDKTGIHSRLLVAKSRVAPARKVQTLPRLELCAAHLLAKLWSTVKPNLSSFTIDDVNFWSDSEIVLHWMKTHPSALNTFVSNRVAQVQDMASDANWRHVPTADNPADIVSRGCDVSELQNSLWFTGPRFLTLDSEMWPENSHSLSPDELALEKKKTRRIALINTEEQCENVILKLIEKVSSYKKILRIIAYVIRFVRCTKNKCRIDNETLEVNELNFAFFKLVEIVQDVELRDDKVNLAKLSLSKQRHIQKLNPFIQQHSWEGLSVSLMRVGGRLSNAPIQYDEKYPLLLSKESLLILRYFEDLHRSNCHAGAKALISLSREKVWVVNARQLARKIISNCVICFKFKPKLRSQIMSDLPRDRVTGCRPFLVCGVDLCGPVLTTLRLRGKPPVKTYIAVFICFASKAVHLEALSDLQTDTFLSTLNRFVGRRGLPQTIWCDNATNFVGTARLWTERERARVQQKSAENGMTFRFIPPRAPHFGGLWESAVKSAKYLLLRTMGHALLTYEELTTVLVDVEAVLNSRPIAAVTEDPNDGVALTPGHLLIGSSLKALPESGGLGSKESSLKRFRLLSSLKEHFWDAWRRDYVRGLQERHKWTGPEDNIKIGDVVIVHEDNLPPQKWVVGRVVEVEASSDGKVRVANIKTPNGVYRRPIHKLAVLPKEDLQEGVDLSDLATGPVLRSTV